MSYTIGIAANLGPESAGGTIYGQLYGSAGGTASGTITTGIVETYPGNWWYLGTIADGFVGSFTLFDFNDAGNSATVAINPQETENADAKTSSRSSHGTADVATALLANANSFKADVSSLATSAGLGTALTEIKGPTWGTTDTLEAIRDRGDVAWLTATGFSTHGTADVVSAMLANANSFKADVSALATSAALGSVAGTVNAILTDTAEIGVAGAGLTVLASQISVDTLAGYVDTEVTAIKAVTDALPDGGTLTALANNVAAILLDTGTDGVLLGTAALAAINAEVDTAFVDVGLTTTVTGRINTTISSRSSHGTADVVTAMLANANSFKADVSALATSAGLGTALTEIKGPTWGTTDTLEAIRDRGDVAWVTATGFSTHGTADVVTAMLANANAFKADVSGIPGTADTIAALMAYVLESGKSVQAAWLDIWSTTVGGAVANDGDNPTSIAYKSPDGSTQITHGLTSTTRSVS